MGKEGYEKDQCYLCKLFTTKWREDGHAPGLEWTIKDLLNGVKLNKDVKAKDKNMGGVKEEPCFKDIRVSCVIWSVLHAMMGIGNDGVAYQLISSRKTLTFYLRRRLG